MPGMGPSRGADPGMGHEMILVGGAPMARGLALS
jgi:hypothetical protein